MAQDPHLPCLFFRHTGPFVFQKIRCKSALPLCLPPALFPTRREKSLKKSIKEAENLLTTNTKKCIQNLSDDEVNELLNIKWIDTLMLSLNKLPELIIDELINSLIKLDEKYANTLKDLQDDIDATSKELCDMIDELSGDDSDMAGLNALKALLKAN